MKKRTGVLGIEIHKLSNLKLKFYLNVQLELNMKLRMRTSKEWMVREDVSVSLVKLSKGRELNFKEQETRRRSKVRIVKKQDAIFTGGEGRSFPPLLCGYPQLKLRKLSQGGK